MVLTTWKEALARPDDLATDEPGLEPGPAHVLRFGSQVDMAGIIAPSADADRAVRYLTKYLSKSIAATFTDPEQVDLAYEEHVDRLHEQVQ